jgi:hypothetical protein
MILKLAGATSVAICLASSASAFEFTGATATLERRDAEDDRGRQDHFTAGVELSFGAGFSTQLSFKNTQYTDSQDFGSRGHELHVIWRPQVEGLALGVFYGEEFFDPWYTYHGIEAKYAAAAFSAEVAALDYSGSGYDARHMTLELGYQINDRFSVYAGHSILDRNDFSTRSTNTYLGASARVAQGFSVYGQYGENDEGPSDRYGIVTLGVRYDFGEGVTFKQRSYNELLPTD